MFAVYLLSPTHPHPYTYSVDTHTTPPAPHKFGCEAFLVSYKKGTVRDIPGLEVIRALPSFRRMEMMTQPGATLNPTIDCFTRPGSVQVGGWVGGWDG